MEKLIKQPNGKYCIVGYFGELDSFNLKEEDVIDMYIEEAKKAMENADHFGRIIEKISVGETYNKPREIYDDYLELMGFDKPYTELVKFIPRKPLNTQYASCDFATYGKCPNCGGSVRNGMGGKDEKCKSCGQLLKW